MGYYLQCTLEDQDCLTLYGQRPNDDTRPKSQLKLPFTNQSCVRDNRLEGNIGRCGWAGAPCVVDAHGNDNCAGGGDQTTVASGVPSICQNGFCRGDVGSRCTGQTTCNANLDCNVTGGYGICGGANAPLHLIDSDYYAEDYCLSGKAYQNGSNGFYCAPGSPMPLPGGPHHSGHFPLWAIIVISVVGPLALVAIVVSLWYLRSKRKKRNVQKASGGGFNSSEKLSSPRHNDMSRSVDIHRAEERAWDDEQSPSLQFDPEDASMIMSPITEVSTLAAYGLNHNHMTALLPEIHEDDHADFDGSFPKNIRIAQTTHTWQLSPKSSLYKKGGDNHYSAKPTMPTDPSVYPAFIVPLVPQKSREDDNTPDGLLFKTMPHSPGASSTLVDEDEAERRYLQLREEAEKGLKEIQERRRQRTDSDSR